MIRRLPPAGIAMLYATFAALWIVLSGAFLDITVADPDVQSRIELVKGLFFVAVSSILLFLLLSSQRSSRACDDQAFAPDARATLAAPFMTLLALVVPLLGTAVYQLNARSDRRDMLQTLTAIADLKAVPVERWLAERRFDALVLSRSAGFSQHALAMQQRSDKAAEHAVLERLTALRDTIGYDSLQLLDPRGRIVAGVGEHYAQAVPPGVDLASVMASGEPLMVFGPPHPDRRLHIDFLAPLASVDGDRREPVGVAVLHIDLPTLLSPIVEGWPNSSSSGAAMIIRRDGNDAVVVSRDPQRISLAPESRLPLSTPDLPAAAAVVDAGSGTIDGVNHRGTPVLAAYRPIAGTDWRMLVMVDRAEALAPSRSLALWFMAIALVAVLMIAAAVVQMMRQQRKAQRLEIQAKNDRLLGKFYELPFVGMAITSPVTKGWLRYNDRLCEILGYTPTELALTNWADLTHPDDLAADVKEFERALRGETDGYQIEKRFVRKDGKFVEAALDIRCLRQPDGTVEYVLATIQDITERKLAEARILRQSKFYAGLSACNAAIVHSTRESDLFQVVCQTAVDAGGMKMAWVGLTDAAGMIRPVERWGIGTEYLRDILISVDAGSAFGRGPTGTAARTQTPFWCQDFQNDPVTEPWHERGRRFGWGSAAALPIMRGGNCVGTLTLYASETNAFDEDARKLLLDMVANLSFALDNFARSAARRAAEVRLVEQLDELRRWHANTLDREDRILELKREVNMLLAQSGQPPRYASAAEPQSRDA
ncbi:MAG: GAF domain-containing protein [Gammaproteobacteria bacterium]|nr:GAF domain-containing protein [Gammaproteobacteria bacterium]